MLAIIDNGFSAVVLCQTKHTMKTKVELTSPSVLVCRLFQHKYKSKREKRNYDSWTGHHQLYSSTKQDPQFHILTNNSTSAIVQIDRGRPINGPVAGNGNPQSVTMTPQHVTISRDLALFQFADRYIFFFFINPFDISPHVATRN